VPIRPIVLRPARGHRLGVLAGALVLVLGASRAVAEGGGDEIEKLNKQALEAYDGLSFDQAKTLLEQALSEADAAGLASTPVAARTHLNLGMVLFARFQEARGPARTAQRDEAIEQFRAALKIQPDLVPPTGLFNPEVQSLFDEVKASAQVETEPTKPAPRTTSVKPRAEPQKNKQEVQRSAKKGEKGEIDFGQGEEEEEEEETPHRSYSPIFLSAGLGWGFGVAKGHLDANKDIMQGNPPMVNNSWSGGLAPSNLGHLLLTFGYFVSSDWMLSIEGRIQIVSGTTTVTSSPSCTQSCSSPSTGIAALAKASWFMLPGPLRPFLAGGLGGGSIRQVVTLTGVKDCGTGKNQPCVDTVTGGPLLLAVGGGLVYEIGSFAVLGTATANVGLPNVMLNIDLIVGLGLRI
jgi:hypothetical protein